MWRELLTISREIIELQLVSNQKSKDVPITGNRNFLLSFYLDLSFCCRNDCVSVRQAYFFNCDHIKSESVLLKTMALGLCLDISLKNVLIITIPFLISWARYRGLEYIIKHYRWVFVCLFLMPISVMYDVYMFIRNWIVFKLNSAPKQHAKKVKDVQRQVSFLF